jgi:hypothetical protein
MVQALIFPTRPRAAGEGNGARLNVARVLAVGGVVAYNWWVVVPFVPGLMPSANGFFSDLEATGRAHSGLMSDADVAAGVLMLVALFLRGSRGGQGVRREWKWMVAFALAGVVGGRYSYACAEGLSETCRQLEWHLELPIHHYIHVVSGIAEFATLTAAAIIAMRRTRDDATPEARIYKGLVEVLAIGYPLLGLVYLTDRLGAFVEPIFFVTFSAMVLTEVFEPIRSGRGRGGNWADRATARGRDSGAVPATPTPNAPGMPVTAADGDTASSGQR